MQFPCPIHPTLEMLGLQGPRSQVAPRPKFPDNIDQTHRLTDEFRRAPARSLIGQLLLAVVLCW
jgi:hypothetical protein